MQYKGDCCISKKKAGAFNQQKLRQSALLEKRNVPNEYYQLIVDSQNQDVKNYMQSFDLFKFNYS